MKAKIGLEEHFSHPDTLGDLQEYFVEGKWNEMKKRLLDVDELRLRLMDQYDMEMMIVSLNAPAIQAISDAPKAVETARRANDLLAEHVSRRSDRFPRLCRASDAGPGRRDPRGEALRRRPRILSARSSTASRRSATKTRPSISTTLATRPSGPNSQSSTGPSICIRAIPWRRAPAFMTGHPWLLGSAWAFGVETATHALRLMGGGLFDRHPKLQVILGHHGEGLPFLIWRVDHRVATAPRGLAIKKSFQEYFRENFYVTTSGSFRTQALLSTLSEIGSDRVLFSTDYPFEEISEAASWFDSASIAENDREKIGRLNAVRLFNL